MKRIHDIYRPTDERKNDWHEVERMLTDGELKEQTSRCMNCGQPFCHAYGCPLGNLVPDQNRAVAQGDWHLAYDLLSLHSDFPEFTSRICPALCEASCVHQLDEESVMVRQSEKRIIETAFANGWVVPHPPAAENGKTAAIIGAGPAGLSAAVTLRRRGWAVTVYERRANIGGLLRYGIPCFKLDKSLIDRRRKLLEAEGIRFVTRRHRHARRARSEDSRARTGRHPSRPGASGGTKSLSDRGTAGAANQCKGQGCPRHRRRRHGIRLRGNGHTPRREVRHPDRNHAAPAR